MLPAVIAAAVRYGFGIAIATAAAGYAWVVLLAALKRLPSPAAPTDRATPPVSILKPLHGADPGLHENLRSFCAQSYPDYELVFGVRDPADPAIAVVQRLRAEFPARAIRLVVDPRVHGRNPKVGNLINMLPAARHGLLVLSDSDIAVPPDYLARVTAPLASPGTGIVTCLYRGVAGPGLWSRLGRQFVDDWFIPSVRLAYAFRWSNFSFGSTIALRRDTLGAIGGFEALRDTLADDFWLGELARRQGLRTVVSDLVVGTQVSEPGLRPLWEHELRWLRTIRAVAPAGFTMLWACFTTPVALLGFALAPARATLALMLAAVTARLLLHLVQRRRVPERLPWHDALSILPRDLLSLCEWATALAGHRVTWRGQVLDARYDRDALHRHGGPATK